MTGSLQQKRLASGNTYFYVKLQYKDHHGKWKHKTIGTGLEVKNNKRKAESLINGIIEKHLYLENISAEADQYIDVLLSDYLDKWLEEKKIDLKKSTHEGYAFRVKRIKDYFEPKKLKVIDITAKDLDTYYKHCLRYGKVNQKTKQKEPLAVRSVRSYKSILYAVFTQACIDGMVKSNPCIGIPVRGKRNSDYSEEMLFLTENEISDLLHYIAVYYPRLLPIAFMGAYYGLRRSEILGLKWSAIDFDKRRLNINHTIVKVKTIVESDTTKTKESRRSLNLFDTAEKCLLKVKEEQESNRKFFGNTYQNKNGYVFTWEDGRCYDPDYISTIFCKATKAYGRPEISLHKLRHSCASMLINKGWDIKKLQYWLGHEDIQTTLNIYSHFDKNRLNTSESELNEISLATNGLFTN